ncbi:MAG: DUF3604 domain-containing protein [Bryobacterales bacterium]
METSTATPEISTDGSGDGSIEDYFRYMVDAASMDTGIVGDHNEGNNDEYSWWRTEKMIDVFLIPGRYTPMFGYERSPSYPNGHRNVVFAQRGVPPLPIPPDEHSGKIPSGPIPTPTCGSTTASACRTRRRRAKAPTFATGTRGARAARRALPGLPREL